MSDARFKFTADTANFDKGANKITSSLGSIKTLAAGVVGGLTAFGAAGVAKGIGAITSGVKDSILSASKAAAAYETMGTQLKVLTGSAETAAKLLRDITKLGVETPLEQTDLQSTTKLLLGFGIEVKEIIPDLRMLGDLAMGNGEKLQSLARAFGKVSSTGRLTTEDLNMFTDAGVNMAGMLSTQMEMSVSELRKTIEDGGVSFDDLKEAMVTATSKGGPFNDMMRKVAGTSEGMLSNFADNINGLKKAMGTGINEGLKTLLGSVNEELPKLTASATQFGEQIGKFLVRITPEITKFVSFINDELSKGKGLTDTITNAFVNAITSQPVMQAMEKLGAAIGQQIYNTSIAGKPKDMLLGKDKVNPDDVPKPGLLQKSYTNFETWTNEMDVATKMASIKVRQWLDDIDRSLILPSFKEKTRGAYEQRKYERQEEITKLTGVNVEALWTTKGMQLGNAMWSAVAMANTRQSSRFMHELDEQLDQIISNISDSIKNMKKSKAFTEDNTDTRFIKNQKKNSYEEWRRLNTDPNFIKNMKKRVEPKFDPFTPLASHMQKIGGAGKFGHHPMMSETKKTNSILTKHTELLTKLVFKGEKISFQ